MFRKKIFLIIEPGKNDTYPVLSWIYDCFMMLMIVISIIPLMFRYPTMLFYWFDRISVTVFIIDYILRWITADFSNPKKRKSIAFLTYPFTTMAIIDMLSILPSIGIIHKTFKIFRIVRLLKLIRIIRLLRYSRRIWTLLYVLKKERAVLLTVLAIASFYILATALIMYNVEMYNHTADGEVVFETFFDALYWATTTLTTVGYGDIYPVSNVGKFVSMLSSLFGVAVIALPSGVITASYLDELRNKKEEKEEE